jgi:hypothetical protein
MTALGLETSIHAAHAAFPRLDSSSVSPMNAMIL